MRAARMLPVGACLSRCLYTCRSACMRCMLVRGCECEWPGLLTSASYMRVCVYACMRICVHAYMRVCAYSYVRMCVCV